MKTIALSPEKVIFTITICLFFTLTNISAQTQSENNIIAVSKDGVELVAQTTLHVAVFPLDASPMKFQVAVENGERGYTKIQFKDTRGNLVHRPVIVTDKARIINFNTNQLKTGTYVIEVSNAREAHRYQVQVGSKVIRSVDVKPGVLAKVRMKE